jgi:hypothetical protein
MQCMTSMAMKPHADTAKWRPACPARPGHREIEGSAKDRTTRPRDLTV